jgi:hypothetical protein
MPAPVTTELVWREIEKQLFAVLGYVTPRGEARTAGIVYVARGRRLYIGTAKDSWKAKHIAHNPRVSLTVTIAKRAPLMPWIKIPAATITFQGRAAVRGVEESSSEILRALTHGVELSAEERENFAILEVEPKGEFVTYGIGVSLMTMRKPEQARGRAPV